MREIKFRVWDKDSKQMDIVSRLEVDDSGHIDTVEGYGGVYYNFELMQFTGLKDKNGKNIYEGDIIHGYDQEPDKYDGYIGSSVIDVVNFKYGAFWIGDSWYNIMVTTPPIVEIIGNIYKNHELLEVKN